MFYSLLELTVWGRKSRAYQRWLYRKQLRLKQRRQFNELAWLLYDWQDYIRG